MAESTTGAINAEPAAISPDDRRRIPSDRRRAGQLLAQGYPAPHVADTLGVERKTIDRWKDSDPDFRTGYFEEEQRLNRVAEVCRIKILLDLPEITDKAVIVAKDMAHRDFGAMARYLIDKVLIPQSVQHVNAHHEIDVTFWQQLDDRLAKITEARDAVRGNGHPPRLLSGEEAAASYGAASLKDSSDAELLDATDQ